MAVAPLSPSSPPPPPPPPLRPPASAATLAERIARVSTAAASFEVSGVDATTSHVDATRR
jgi:hypothetical protein